MFRAFAFDVLYNSFVRVVLNREGNFSVRRMCFTDVAKNNACLHRCLSLLIKISD